MTYLLDVNVLIALIDPKHLHHRSAMEWFATTGRHDWASCPLTENGVLRIVGNPRYRNSPGSPVIVSEVLLRLRQVGHHVFWHDEISLLDTAAVDPIRLLSHEQITDTYLLALTVAKGGKLATFDARLTTNSVHGGAAALHLIPTA
ncbi:MAG TPA: TA system VapC family ribonuclease toxin [Bosea sp. (in: a-proteobacteria)]